MSIEALAVRSGARRTRVIRTGMGPHRSALGAARLSARPPAAARAVVVTGVCGALDPRLRPGDIVVASEVRSAHGGSAQSLAGCELLAATLRRAGLTVHVGPVVSSDHPVSGSERTALAATGAIAVDMESSVLLGAAGDLLTDGGSVAVVRAVVDTPGQELRSPATVAGGIKACRSLRTAAAVLERWAAAIQPRRVLLAGPRSYCAGVERAISTVERALQQTGGPVYVRRQIVHNRHVVATLEQAGAVFVEELDDVPDGSTVVFSAHGVAPAVRRAAQQRELSVIDATCPLVTKVHNETRRFLRQGYEVVLIGHPDHDETEGHLGEAPGMPVVTTVHDVANLEVRDHDRVAYVTQTTLAIDEVAGIITALRQRFPAVVGPRAEDICYATQNRQDAVRAIAADCELILVIGSPNSSNSNRLVEVGRRSGCRAELLDDASELDIGWLTGVSTIGVTAGASAPPALVDSLVNTLASLGPLAVEERPVSTETVSFSLPPEVR